ncbi:hypothetical protein SVIOM74S_01091 [Streptomyces violarus]
MGAIPIQREFSGAPGGRTSVTAPAPPAGAHHPHRGRRSPGRRRLLRTALREWGDSACPARTGSARTRRSSSANWSPTRSCTPAPMWNWRAGAGHRRARRRGLRPPPLPRPARRGRRPDTRRTAAACASSRPSPNPGASPTAAAPRRCGRRRPATNTGSTRTPASPCPSPICSPPSGGGPNGTASGWGAAPSFLAEASDLLAGQLDEDLVAALTRQLLVPRLADWCAIWLEDEAMGGRARRPDGGIGAPGPRLARVWHLASEDHMEELRRALEKPAAQHGGGTADRRAGALPLAGGGPERRPQRGLDRRSPAPLMAFRLVAGDGRSGLLVIGPAGGTAPAARRGDRAGGRDRAAGWRWPSGRHGSYARQGPRSAPSSSAGCCRGMVPDIWAATAPWCTSRAMSAGPAAASPTTSAGDGRWCFAIGGRPRARAPRPPW